MFIATPVPASIFSSGNEHAGGRNNQPPFVILSPMRNTSVLRLSAAAVLCGALWVAYSQFGTAPAKLDLVKIKEDLYVIHNEIVPGNSTVLITNDGVLLVDDKFEIDHNGIMEQLKKVTNKPIKYVVNTHHHADHSGGNAKMQDMSAVIVASEQARENMVDGKQPGLPNIVIEHHAHIYIGGKNVELYHFGRAHTNGDVVVYFPADRTLAAGDMFTFGDATPLLLDYEGGGSGKEWTKTLETALQPDYDTVGPGHGNDHTKQDMAKFIQTTISVRNRIHELVSQKKTRDEIAKAMQSEFHWGELQLARSLDGAMAEMR
jgi:glyoxylase-like metal-dependent hydrolase (beta-lactamase superfamily II)